MPQRAAGLEAPASRAVPPRVVRAVRDAVYRAAVVTGGLTARDLLAVAVSGGPDSMVLLDALLAAGERGGPALHALHFDHAWHDGSAAVAEAVDAACRTSGVPMTRERAATPAPERGESLEMAARRQRQEFLRRAAAAMGAARVATGHQADDQVETILMNLARGGGPDALRGMRLDDGWTLRPLLTVWRDQIEAYAAACRLPIQRDPANHAPAFRRNRMRHELLPLLEDIYPGARKALLRAGRLAAPRPAPAVRSTHGIRMPLASDRRAVAAGPLRDGVNAALRGDGQPSRQIGASLWRALEQALADHTAGRWIQLPAGRWAYVRDRAIALYGARVSDPPLDAPVRLVVPGDVDLPVGRLRVRRVSAHETARRSSAVQAMVVPPPGAALAVRTPRPGDQIVSPVDGRAHDLIRLLRRRRVPAALRDGTPVVTVDDRPVCVPDVPVDATHRPPLDGAEALTIEIAWAPLPAAGPPGGFVTEPAAGLSTLDPQEELRSDAAGPLI